MKPLWLSTALLMLAACGDPNAPVCDVRDLLVGYTDADADGYGTGVEIQYCPGYGQGLAPTPLDCDDEDETRNPGAMETCNGIDDDCDGEIDQGFDNRIYYEDADLDGFGARYKAQRACERPDGYVLNSEDCDDNNRNINPDAPEVCNDGIDDDCDGVADDTDPSLLDSSRLTFYLDGDADGYGTPFVRFEACAPQSNWVENGDDCNDNNQRVHPGADEICNDNVDDDCDNLADDADPSILPSSQITVYRDIDQDGFGDPAQSFLACRAVAGFSSTSDQDCDDSDALISPDQTDICNGGVDDDCDASTDEEIVSGTGYYVDTDGDGFGDTATEILSCTPIAGRVTRPGDCDEQEFTVNPDAFDTCEDGTDQDCSGTDARCRNAFAVSSNAKEFGSNDLLRGIVLEATTPELVIDFGLRVTLSDPCTFDYYVWSRPDDASPWTLEAAQQVDQEPMNVAFAMSGELDVQVTPGVQYAYGVGYSCPSNVLFYAADNTNIFGTFVLGTYVGKVQDPPGSYTGFNLGHVPSQFATNTSNVPNFEFGYSTSFMP